MGWLSDLLKDFPALSVARERLALLETKFSDLEAENRQLNKENERLSKENQSLQKQLPDTNFVESQGVLFKRKSDGTFENVAYCPDCQRPLSTISNAIPPRCSKCNFNAPFRRNEIPQIIAELQG